MSNVDANTPQLKAVMNWTNAFSTLDMKNVEPFLTENFTWRRFPKVPDLADDTKEEHLQRYGKVLASIAKFEPIIYEVIDAPGKVVMHTTGRFTTVDGTIIDNDIVLIISLVEEDGELKIVEVKEFADPDKRSALIRLLTPPEALRAS